MDAKWSAGAVFQFLFEAERILGPECSRPCIQNPQHPGFCLRFVLILFFKLFLLLSLIVHFPWMKVSKQNELLRLRLSLVFATKTFASVQGRVRGEFKFSALGAGRIGMFAELGAPISRRPTLRCRVERRIFRRRRYTCRTGALRKSGESARTSMIIRTGH